MLSETSSSQWFAGLNHRVVFVGRDEELSRLEQLLQQPQTLLALYGPPGVGKTALCIQWARSTELPVLWLAHGALERPQLLWQALAESLGLWQGDRAAKASAEETEQAIFAALSHREPCVLWCDDRQVDDESAAILVRLLRKAPQHRVLLSLSGRLHIPGAFGMELRGLQTEHAVSLFTRCAQEVAVSFELNAHTRPNIERIVERLDGNPLGIEIVASQLLLHQLPYLVERLDDSLLDMQNVWRGRSAQQQSLRAALMPVWRELDDDARLTMFAISFWQTGVSLGDLEVVLTELDAPDLYRVALVLRSRALLERVQTVGSEVFRLNSMIRELTLDEISLPEAQRQALVQRCVERMIQQAQHALDVAICQRDRKSRANLERCLGELSRWMSHPVCGVEAMLVTQRAQRLLGAMTPRDETLYRALLPLTRMPIDSAEDLRVHFEVLCIEHKRGQADAPRLLTLIERAQQMKLHALCGEMRRLYSLYLQEGGDLPAAIAQVRLAIELFEQVGDDVSASHSLYLLVAHQLNLLNVGHQVDDAQLARDMRAHRQSAVAIGGYYRELYEYNVAYHAVFTQSPEDVISLIEAGIARTTDTQLDPLIGLRWRQFLHYCLSRFGADSERILDVGQDVIEHFVHAAIPIGSIVLVQSMSLQALGRFEATAELLARYETILDAEVLKPGAAGTMFIARATNAIVFDDLPLASRELSRAAEVFGAYALPVNRFVVAMFEVIVDVLALRMSEAHRAMARAEAALSELDAHLQADRRPVLELCQSFLSRNHAKILAHIERLQTHRSRNVQIISQTLRRVLPQLEAESESVDVNIAIDGTWFELAGDQRVDLAHRVALTRILSALLKQFNTHPGEGLSMYELIELGWPDDALDLDAGTNRVRAAIYALRSLGLRDVLINQNGYLLDPKQLIIAR